MLLLLNLLVFSDLHKKINNKIFLITFAAIVSSNQVTVKNLEISGISSLKNSIHPMH